jgi:hypothetical protein
MFSQYARNRQLVPAKYDRGKPDRGVGRSLHNTHARVEQAIGKLRRFSE